MGRGLRSEEAADSSLPRNEKSQALHKGVPEILWLRGQDLNLRPSGYEPDELPNCSTPRYRIVCCLSISLIIIVQLPEKIKRYFSNLKKFFPGRRGENQPFLFFWESYIIKLAKCFDESLRFWAKEYF